MGVLQSCKRLSFSLTSILMCCTRELFSYNDRVLCRYVYSFVKENSDLIRFTKRQCVVILRYDIRTTTLETAILKSPNILLCYFDTGASLIWIFLYDALKSLHHTASDWYYLDFDFRTLQ